jgi:hypothetical protein
LLLTQLGGIIYNKLPRKHVKLFDRNGKIAVPFIVETKEMPLCQHLELINPKRTIAQKYTVSARECRQKTAVRLSPAAAQRADMSSPRNGPAGQTTQLIF